MRRLIDLLLGALQRRCTHPPGAVAADLLEGCVPDRAVWWCRRCGATRVVSAAGSAAWKVPRADL